MVDVRSGVVAGLTGLVTLLAGITLVAGLSPTSWAVGLACGLVLAGWVGRTVAGGLGPADLVTLGRAVLGCGVAALVVESSPRQTTLLLTASVIALALDAVDGRVARATHRQTDFGARFDGEADAFLILVLSVHVAAAYGPWVLAIGAARYTFGLAGLFLPWLRERLPARQWRKVVAAAQGITLVVAAAEVVPVGLAQVALALALVLLAESFGRDVWWLHRRHGSGHAAAARAAVTHGADRSST